MNENEDDRPTLTAAEAFRLPREELRARFCEIAGEMWNEYGDSFDDCDISAFRHPAELTTEYMLQLLADHPTWFAPKELRKP